MINYETYSCSPDGYALEGKLFRIAIGILEDYLGWLEEDSVKLSDPQEEELESIITALNHLKRIRPYYVGTYQARHGDMRELVTEEMIYSFRLLKHVMHYNNLTDRTKFDVFSEKENTVITEGLDYKEAVYNALDSSYFHPKEDRWVWPTGYTLMSERESDHTYMTSNLRSFRSRACPSGSLLEKVNEDFYTQLSSLHHSYVEKNQDHVEFRAIMDHIKAEEHNAD
jgi:hypothetical protein